MNKEVRVQRGKMAVKILLKKRRQLEDKIKI